MKFSDTIHCTHAEGKATFSDGLLTVSTGPVTRQWRLVDTGLRTISFKQEPKGREWITPGHPAHGADWSDWSDWSLNALTARGSHAILQSVEATVVHDAPAPEGLAPASEGLALAPEGFLLVRCLFAYPAYKAEALYEVRAYPGAPGLWTRLSLRLTEAMDKMKLPLANVGAFSESLCLNTRDCQRTVVGYYNDTQHRNHDDLNLLREETLPAFDRRQVVDWANLVSLEKDGEGLVVVKESHKCVNQPGVDTGAFVIKPHGIQVTGLGLKSNNYKGGHWLRHAEGFRPCWAHWTLLYTGERFERQRAVKTFDQKRFPFIPERDEKILENTWGTRGAWEGGAPEASESQNVMREIRSCADLGIDVVQIDHGWAAESENTTPEAPWTLCPEKYPEGWEPVLHCASEHGVELGLWFSWHVPVDKLLAQYRAAGIRRFKLDFINVESRDDLDEINEKVRRLIAQTDPLVGINWDATEEMARMGYFYGREHGNIFLENRENGPDGAIYLNHIRYTPRLALRDFWELSHYLNLNQIQLNLQDIDRVERDVSNAWRYRMDYLFAMTMMGVPLFFFETQLLSEGNRELLKPLIAIYKKHRANVHRSTVYPLGSEPDDTQWTGFQAVLPEKRTGYFTLFREIDNTDATRTLMVPFLDGANTLRLSDLVSGETTETMVGADGRVDFSIPEPGDFRFFHYMG